MDENEDEKLARMLQSQFDQVPFLNQNTFDLVFKYFVSLAIKTQQSVLTKLYLDKILLT